MKSNESKSLAEIIGEAIGRAMDKSLASSYKKEIRTNKKNIEQMLIELNYTSKWRFIKRMDLNAKISYLVKRNNELENAIERLERN